MAECFESQPGGLGGLGRPVCPVYYDRRFAPKLHFSSSSHNYSPLLGGLKGGTSPHHQDIPPFFSGERYHQGGVEQPASFLLQAVRGHKKGRPLSGHNRPLQVEQAVNRPYFPDGVCFKDSRRHCGMPVGLYHRSEGCLFPLSDSVAFSRLSGLHSGWKGICIPIPSFRSGSSPMGIPQNNQTCNGLSAQTEGENSFLPGRFPKPSSFPAGTGVKYSDHPGSFSQTRDLSQCQEVLTDSFQKCCLPGGSPSSRQVNFRNSARHSYENCLPLQQGAKQPLDVSSSTGEHHGPSQFCGSLGSVGKTQAQAPHHLDESPLFSGFKGCPSSSGRPLQTNGPCMAVKGVPKPLRADDRPCPSSPADDRRLQVWLERSSSPPQGFGSLAQEALGTLHQLAGASGSVPISSSLHEPSQGSQRTSVVRQHDGSFVLVAPGNITLACLDGPFSKGLRILPYFFHHFGSQIPGWVFKCPGRQWLPTGSSVDGVGTGRCVIPMARAPRRAFSSRPIRDQRQREATVIRVSLSGSSGNGGECFFPPLGGVGEGLPFPTCPSAQVGSSSPSLLQRQRCLGSTVFSGVGLVPGASRKVSSSSSSPGSSLPVSDDQARHCLSSESFGLPTSRVAFMRLGLSARGFNRLAVEMTLRAHRVSTSRQYQSVWSSFRKYVSSCGHSLSSVPSAALVGLVCNF